MSNRAAAAPLTQARVRPMIVGSHVVAHLVLVAISLIALVPIYWMVSTALKGKGMELEWPIRWIPDPIVWDNFIRAHTILPFGTYYRNTLLIAVLTTLGMVFSSSTAGFAFA